MRFTFSTLPCMNADYTTLIDLCKKHNLNGVEIRTDQDNRIVSCNDSGKLKEIGQSFIDSGLQIIAIGTGICFQNYDSSLVSKAKKIIDDTRLIQGRGVRVFLGNFTNRFDDAKSILDENGIVKSLQEICDYSPQTDIMVETHNEYATGKVLKQLWKRVNRDNLKFIWDIIHPIEDNETIEDTWNYIGLQLAHIHIKDGKKKKDPVYHDYEYTLLGEGELPLENLVNLLKKEKYDKFFSLEWENTWRPELLKYPHDMDWILNQFNQRFRYRYFQ